MDIPHNWRILLDRSDLEIGVGRCAEKLNQMLASCGREVIMICVLKGGSYFFTDLTRRCSFPHAVAFVDVISYHGQEHTAPQLICHLKPEEVKNKMVVLVDELCDSGASLQTLLNHFHAEMGVEEACILSCVLLQKDKPRVYHPDVVGFERIPDVWLVGYGLDDNQKLRNLVDLYAVPKPITILPHPDERLFYDPNLLQSIRMQLLFEAARI